MTLFERHSVVVFLGAGLLLVFFVLFPFLIPLLLGAVFATLFAPVYAWVLRYYPKRKTFSAVVTTILFVLLVGIPLTGIGALGYLETVSWFSSDRPLIGPYLDLFVLRLQDFVPVWLDLDVAGEVNNIITFLVSNIGSVFKATLQTVLDTLLMLLSFFFFLREGELWEDIVVTLCPLSPAHTRKVLDDLRLSIHGIVRGYLFVALLQGILMGLGFWFFGIPHAFLWGMATAVAALVPVAGTAIIWVPAVAYVYVVDGALLAVLFFAWSSLLVGYIDNVINPFIVGKRISIHPLFVLLSILGGISLFGLSGIFWGPLSVTFLNSMMKLYRER